jgi:glycosyltransferase involved in cell wall biosynthesis
MGIGHERDLASVLPVLTKFLRNNPNITFELFGTIPMPEQLKEFGDRVTRAPKIDNYEEFMRYLASIEWDIGICPLTPINFNMMKSNNKWIEYSSVGAAVVASRGTVYDECCADGCGVLVATEDEWYSALDRLVRYPDVRFDLVRRAQDKLARSYSTERLREQVLNVFRQAHTLQVESKLREFKQ